MNGHVRNVRQTRAEDAKPDSMIIGREAGPEDRNATPAKLGQVAPLSFKNIAT